MATWLPLPGAIPQFAARYVDPAMGFAVGWNQWYSNALTQCSEISAAATLIAFWAPDISPAPWITIIIVFIVCLNIFAVKIYGEAEFLFASIKIITIFGLLIFAFIVDLGGNPLHDRIGFRYWVRPGAMVSTEFGFLLLGMSSALNDGNRRPPWQLVMQGDSFRSFQLWSTLRSLTEVSKQ